MATNETTVAAEAARNQLEQARTSYVFEWEGESKSIPGLMALPYAKFKKIIALVEEASAADSETSESPSDNLKVLDKLIETVPEFGELAEILPTWKILEVLGGWMGRGTNTLGK